MKTRLLHSTHGLKTFALVFEKDEDVREPLLLFAREHGISGAHVSAIGAFSEVTLGYFDRHKKAYQEIPVHEQVEVLAFSGNLARHENNCFLHAHVVVGKADGSTAGGHFLRGKVWPTLEMVLVESPQSLRRVRDEETGLPLIDLTA
ncbi:MAG: PPC domain-containing DNA-binding protein [Actinomycetota bacterium]